MAVIDHLVITVPDLDFGIRWFEQSTGVRPGYGGAHTGLGTHNALVSLGDSYAELIAPDPAQPEPAGPRPFGVDADSDPALATYAVRPDEGESIEQLARLMGHVGHDPGDVVSMSRTTADGDVLRWRLTVPPPHGDGFVPFLIDWGDTPHPSTTTPGGVRLVELSGAHDTPDDVNPVLDALGLGWFATRGTTGLGAVLEGPDSRIWSL